MLAQGMALVSFRFFHFLFFFRVLFKKKKLSHPPFFLPSFSPPPACRHPAPLEATQAAAQVASTPEEPCAPRAKSFVACMTDEMNNGDLEACRYYLDSLQACRRQTAGGGGGSEMQ